MRRIKAHFHRVPVRIANLSIFIEMGIRLNQEDGRTLQDGYVQGGSSRRKRRVCGGLRLVSLVWWKAERIPNDGYRHCIRLDTQVYSRQM